MLSAAAFRANNHRLRKVATSDQPLCDQQKSHKSSMNQNNRLVTSASESALENVTDTILTPISYLSKKQKKHIVLTWVAVKDRTQFGQKVYAEVFRRQPNLQDYYPSLHGCPIQQEENGETEKNAAFRCQASAFSDFLDYAVSFVHLDSSNFISEASFQIGRRHAERMKCVDSIPHSWWQIFSESILSCLKPYFPINDSVVSRLPVVRHVIDRSYKRSWRILLNVIIDHMQQGYGDYKREERRSIDQHGVARMPPMATPCQNQLKKLAAMAAALQAKGKKLYSLEHSESDIDDLCDSDDTSSNSSD